MGGNESWLQWSLYYPILSLYIFILKLYKTRHNHFRVRSLDYLSQILKETYLVETKDIVQTCKVWIKATGLSSDDSLQRWGQFALKFPHH